eukprot:Rmarinus@m.11013
MESCVRTPGSRHRRLQRVIHFRSLGPRSPARMQRAGQDNCTSHAEPPLASPQRRVQNACEICGLPWARRRRWILASVAAAVLAALRVSPGSGAVPTLTTRRACKQYPSYFHLFNVLLSPRGASGDRV